MSPQTTSNRHRELWDTALGLFIQKTRDDVRQQRSWIKRPANLLSLFAILISVASILYQVFANNAARVDHNLTALSGVLSDLTDVDVKAATSGGLGQRWAVNRRALLLGEADALIKDLGGRAPQDELSILGIAYSENGDYRNSIKYLRLMTGPAVRSTVRLGGWRSIGGQYFNEGPGWLNHGRDAYRKAADVYPNPNDDAEAQMKLEVYEEWGQAELRYQFYANAATEFAGAREVANLMTCGTYHTEVVQRIEKEWNGAASAVKEPQLSAERLNWAKILKADKCSAVPSQATNSSS